jgi:hypothetical protein
MILLEKVATLIMSVSYNPNMASMFVHTLLYLDKHTKLFIEPKNTSEELGTECVSKRTV